MSPYCFSTISGRTFWSLPDEGSLEKFNELNVCHHIVSLPFQVEPFEAFLMKEAWKSITSCSLMAICNYTPISMKKDKRYYYRLREHDFHILQWASNKILRYDKLSCHLTSAVEIHRTCRTIRHFLWMTDKKCWSAGPNVRQKNIQISIWWMKRSKIQVIIKDNN